MNKLKKTAAVAVMVGGMALGGGVAYAGEGRGYDDPSTVVIDNLQVMECDQSFDGGALFTPTSVAGADDASQVIGNFCTVDGPDND